MRLGNQHVCFRIHKKNEMNKMHKLHIAICCPMHSAAAHIQFKNTTHPLYTLHTHVNKLAHGKRKRGGVKALIRDEMLAQIAPHGP